MVDGDWKVTLGATDYENTRFTDLIVTGRENGVSSAVLTAVNDGDFWDDVVAVFAAAKVYVEWDGAYRQLFSGTVRLAERTSSQSGRLAILKCKGLGAALEETHCKDQFGYTSNQDGLDTIEEIVEDLVDNSVNKSYSSVNNTGYALTKTYIPTIDAGLSIPFFNAPYQTSKAVIDLICMLDTAYRAGATAGPHYFVDVLGNLRIKTVGSQQVDGGGGGGNWGAFYHGLAASAAESTLTESVDFVDYSISKPTDQYANNVVIAFDLRKPAYDYLTEDSGVAAWGSSGFTSVAAVNGAGPPIEYVVGSHSVRCRVTAPETGGYLYWPSTKDAGWDVTKWGSEKNPPRVEFYMMKHGAFAEVASSIRFFTTNEAADYYYCLFSTWGDADDVWVHKSIPFGPYWASQEESKQYRWVGSGGTEDWTDINGFSFALQDDPLGAFDFFIDDWHLSGKAVREAVDTGEVTANNEHQHVVLSKTPLDDTGEASDDSGMAGQIAYSELLRRVCPPRELILSTRLRPYVKPGEQWTIYLGKTSAGTYKVDGVVFRTTQYMHRISMGGLSTTLTLTDDVLNSFPLSRLDQRAVLNEYLLENNEKATDMQGGDVDLLISHMRKTY